MDDPQIWVLIGVFTTIMLGGMTLMTTLLSHTIRAEVGRLDAKIDGGLASLDAKIDGRFDALDARLNHLDRDVAHLMRRAWGEPSD